MSMLTADPGEHGRKPVGGALNNDQTNRRNQSSMGASAGSVRNVRSGRRIAQLIVLAIGCAPGVGLSNTHRTSYQRLVDDTLALSRWAAVCRCSG
jgi:hypothetical protein